MAAAQTSPATRFCVLVDGNAAMGQHWPALRLFYIEPLLRGFDQGRLGAFELALVVYHTRSAFSPCRVESGGWTASLSKFRQWLDAVPHTGGDSCESALAEGLAEAVFLFKRPSELGKPGDVQNQCLLVTASEPHRLGVLWPFPNDCKEGLADHINLLQALSTHNIEFSIIIRYLKKLSSTALQTFVFANKDVPRDSSGHKPYLVGHQSNCLALVSPRWPAALALLKAEVAKHSTSLRTGSQADAGIAAMSTPTGVATPPVYTPPIQGGSGQTPLSPGAAAQPSGPSRAAGQPSVAHHTTGHTGVAAIHANGPGPMPAGDAAKPSTSSAAAYLLGTGQVMQSTASGNLGPLPTSPYARQASPSPQPQARQVAPAHPHMQHAQQGMAPKRAPQGHLQQGYPPAGRPQQAQQAQHGSLYQQAQGAMQSAGYPTPHLQQQQQQPHHQQQQQLQHYGQMQQAQQAQHFQHASHLQHQQQQQAAHANNPHAQQAHAYSPAAQQAHSPPAFSNSSSSAAPYMLAASPRRPMHADSPTGSQVAAAIQGAQPLWQGQICVGAKLLHNGPDQMLYAVQAYAAGQTCPPDLGSTWPARIVFDKLTPQRSFVKAAGQLLGPCPKVFFAIVEKTAYGETVTRDMIQRESVALARLGNNQTMVLIASPAKGQHGMPPPDGASPALRAMVVNVDLIRDAK